MCAPSMCTKIMMIPEDGIEDGDAGASPIRGAMRAGVEDNEEKKPEEEVSELVNKFQLRVEMIPCHISVSTAA